MKLTYLGRSTKGVEVPAAGVVVGHGETADIPAEVAESLLAQGGWEKANKTPKTTESEADES